MLAAALEAEVDAYIAGPAGEREERGHRLVVRNGGRAAHHHHGGGADQGDRAESERQARRQRRGALPVP